MVDYNPFDDVMKDDPFPVYKRLREESPVHYIEAFDSWALSRFEDILRQRPAETSIASGNRFFSPGMAPAPALRSVLFKSSTNGTPSARISPNVCSTILM